MLKTTATGCALLVNEVGLHARPSVKLTQLARRFVSAIEFALAPEGPWTDAKSPVKVMRVKASKGSRLYLRCHGPDAEAALTAVRHLIDGGFEEGPAT